MDIALSVGTSDCVNDGLRIPVATVDMRQYWKRRTIRSD